MGRPRPRRYQPSALHGTVVRRPQPRIRIDRGLAWYCLWTAPRAEAKVTESLREVRLGVYAPVEALSVARRGRLVETERLVLGRYVFVGLNAAAPQWEAVFAALQGPFGWVMHRPSLARVLMSAEDIPLRVPASDLQNLANGLEGAASGRSAPERGWQVGKVVKAAGGPLAGIAGAFHDADEARVRALFNLFGRKTLVEFRPGQLRAA